MTAVKGLAVDSHLFPTFTTSLYCHDWVSRNCSGGEAARSLSRVYPSETSEKCDALYQCVDCYDCHSRLLTSPSTDHPSPKTRLTAR